MKLIKCLVYNQVTFFWWTRSSNVSVKESVGRISTSGNIYDNYITWSIGVVPMCII